MAQTPKKATTHAEQVGVLCARWADLELAIDAHIWMLAGLNNKIAIGACITAQYMSIHQRIQALLALSRHFEFTNKTISSITKFHGHVRGIADKRNRIVHDAWVPTVLNDQSLEMAQWSLGIGKDVNRIARPVPIQEIKKTISDVQGLHEEFKGVGKAVLSEHRASQKKPPA